MLRPGSWSVSIYDESSVLPSGSLYVMSFDIITVAIVGVVCLDIGMFTSASEISSMYLLGELGGVPILLIKLILGVLIVILFIIVPNLHLHPFSLPPNYFLVVGLLFVDFFIGREYFTSTSEIASADPAVIYTLCYCWIC